MSRDDSPDAGPRPATSPEKEAGARAAAGRAREAGVAWAPCPAASRLPPTLDCGTVTVPVDYADPHGRTVDLHLSRSPASGPSEDRQGALLYNPGGPGGDGMAFPLSPQRLPDQVWRDLHHAYDLVGFAPRGVGLSAPLSCQDPQEFVRGPKPAPRDPSDAFKERMNEEAARFAQGCHAEWGEDLAHLTTADGARDLYTINAALGEEKVTYLGASWGSYLGAVYATLFPDTVGRMVLDSVVDPDPALIWYRGNLRQSRAFEERWRSWKEWVAAHHDHYGLGEDAEAVQRQADRARDVAEQETLGGGVGAKELHAAFVRVVYSDHPWPRTAAALAAFHHGDHRPLRDAARPDTGKDAAERKENATAVYTAVQCADGPWPTDWARWDRDHSRLARHAPFETWENAWLNLPCAHWPVEGSEPLDVSTAPGALPPVVLVHATEDAATPYAGAVETQRRLAGSSLVTEEGAGQHGVIGGNPCVDRHVADYLLSGTVPDQQVGCPARPAPKPAPSGEGLSGVGPSEPAP